MTTESSSWSFRIGLAGVGGTARGVGRFTDRAELGSVLGRVRVNGVLSRESAPGTGLGVALGVWMKAGLGSNDVEATRVTGITKRAPEGGRSLVGFGTAASFEDPGSGMSLVSAGVLPTGLSGVFGGIALLS